MALTFIYGDYTLDPKPLFNISKEYIKTPANTGLGTRYNLTLEGDLLPFVADGLDQGITGVFDGVKRLREACAVVTLENDLEEVVVALAKTVVEKSETFVDFCDSISDDMECTCGQYTEEEKEEIQRILEEEE